MNRKTNVVSVRMPDELHARIRNAAGDDYRSVSDELNYLLTLGLKARDRVAEAQEAVTAGTSQINPDFMQAARGKDWE